MLLNHSEQAGKLGSADREKDKQSSTHRYIAAIMVVLCVFIGDMARGMLFPTLWLFVKSNGGTRYFQGCAVSAFSAGRILSTPLFGDGSEIIGYRYILITCNFIILLGCYSYSLSNSVWWIVASQFVIGVGAGSLGVTRSYVAETTSTSNRTVFMAYLTAVQYIGFSVTPFIGAMVSAWGDQLNIDFGFLKLNKYSMPALVVGLTALTCAVLVLLLFTELHRGHEEAEHTGKDKTADENDNIVNKDSEQKPLIADRDIERSSSADNNAKEDDGTADEHFHKLIINSYQHQSASSPQIQKSRPQVQQQQQQQQQQQGENSHHVNHTVTENNNSNDARNRKCCGFAIANVLAVAGSIYSMIMKGTISVFETLGLVFVTSHYNWSSARTGVTFSVCGAVGVVFLLSFSLLLRCAEDVDMVLYGLLVMLASCVIFASLLSATLPLWEFYIGIVMMYSVGYPIGQTALLGVFSKLKKTGPQGRILGLFGSAGSLARILFPLLAGTLTEFFGDKVIFLVMAVILTISSVVFAMFKTTVRDVIA